MTTEKIEQVPIDQLVCRPQVRERFDEESLLGLAMTLREVGQQQPIRVRREGDQLVILDGERRWRAARKAKAESVAVIVEDRELSEAEVIHRQLVSAIQREALGPPELAKAISRLMKAAGWSESLVATKLGLSAARVTKLLAILALPEPMQARVGTDIPASAAYELARVGDPARQSELAEQVASGRLTRDGLCGQVRAAREKSTTVPTPSSPPAAQPSRVRVVLGGDRSLTLCGRGLTLESVIAWLEELLAKARKARPQGLELSTFIKMLRDQAKSWDPSRGEFRSAPREE